MESKELLLNRSGWWQLKAERDWLRSKPWGTPAHVQVSHRPLRCHVQPWILKADDEQKMFFKKWKSAETMTNLSIFNGSMTLTKRGPTRLLEDYLVRSLWVKRSVCFLGKACMTGQKFFLWTKHLHSKCCTSWELQSGARGRRFTRYCDLVRSGFLTAQLLLLLGGSLATASVDLFMHLPPPTSFIRHAATPTFSNSSPPFFLERAWRRGHRVQERRRTQPAPCN